MVRQLPKKGELDVQEDKENSARNNKEGLFFAKLVTKSDSRVLIGKSRELNHINALKDKVNNKLSSYDEHINEPENKNYIKSTDLKPRGKVLHRNKMKHLNSQENQVKDGNLIHKTNNFDNVNKSPFLKLMFTTKTLKTGNHNVNKLSMPNVEEVKTRNSNLASQYLTAGATKGNELPLNILKSEDDDVFVGENSNPNYQDFDISNYKSDSRNGCLPNTNNKSAKKNRGPEILFDREQDDGQVSLMYTLINLKTLKPKTRFTFEHSGHIKKITTPDKCECLTKASTKKPTTNSRCTTPCSSTVTCQNKNKKHKMKTHSCETVHTTKCSTRKTSCVTTKVCESKKPYTPLFTILPDLKSTRNHCLSSKSTRKSSLGSPAAPVSSAFPPRSFNTSLASSSLQSTRSLLNTTEYITQKDVRPGNNFQPLPLTYNLSTNTDQKANTTTYTSTLNTQSGVSLTTGGSNPPQESGISGMTTNNGSRSMQLPISSSPASPLVSNEVVGGIGTYSSQALTVASTVTNSEETKLPTTSSTLQSELANSPEHTTQSISTSSDTYLTQASSADNTPLTAITNAIKVNAADSETLKNSLTISGTTQSTPFVEISDKEVKNTDITVPPTTVSNVPEISTSNFSFVNIILTSSLSQESVQSTLPGIESPSVLSLSPSTDENNNRPGNETGFESQVPVTNATPHPEEKTSYIDVSSTSATTVKDMVQNEWNDLNFGFDSSPTTVTKQTQTTVEEALSTVGVQIMNFSTPPSVVFSHEPEFIVTLFNDNLSDNVKCGVLSINIKLSTDDPQKQSEAEPSLLQELFPQSTTPVKANQSDQDQVQSHVLNEELNTVTTTADPNKSISSGYLKSFASANDMHSFSKDPMNAHFSKNINAANNCLVEFSRIFSGLETTKCEQIA